MCIWNLLLCLETSLLLLCFLWQHSTRRERTVVETIALWWLSDFRPHLLMCFPKGLRLGVSLPRTELLSSLCVVLYRRRRVDMKSLPPA